MIGMVPAETGPGNGRSPALGAFPVSSRPLPAQYHLLLGRDQENNQPGHDTKNEYSDPPLTSYKEIAFTGKQAAAPEHYSRDDEKPGKSNHHHSLQQGRFPAWLEEINEADHVVNTEHCCTCFFVFTHYQGYPGGFDGKVQPAKPSPGR